MVNPLERLRPHDAEKFHASYIRGADQECWVWARGYRYKKGKKTYGLFNVGHYGKLKANRVAYALARGPFPKELHVLHTCDNPCCVNPGHLFLGTNQDNINDKVRKGRSRTASPSIISLPDMQST